MGKSRIRSLLVVLLLVSFSTAAFASLQTYLKRAQAYIRHRNYSRAVEMLHKALQLEPDNIDVYYNIGIVAQKGKLWKDALLALQGYLAVDSKGADHKKVRAALNSIKKRKLKKRAVLLTVNCPTSEAEFYLNGHLIGKSPKIEVTLYPGTYTLKSKKTDYNLFSQTFKVKAGETKVITTTLKARTFYGFIQLSTDPPKGVTVMLDKKKIGVTPLAKFKVEAKKKFLITLSAKGYDRWMRYVTAPKNQTITVKAKLFPPEK